MEQTTTRAETIRLLIWEDSPGLAASCLLKLKGDAWEAHADAVWTPIEFMERMDSCPYDIVLAGRHTSEWNVLDALRWMDSKGYQSPLILVTDVFGDEFVNACIKAGASDYVVKQELQRLPMVIGGILSEKKLRIDRDRAEQELRDSEEQYRLLFKSNPNPMWVCDMENLRFLAVNDAAVMHYGYSPKEFLAMRVADLHPEEVTFLDRRKTAGDFQEDYWSLREVWKHVKKNGATIDVEISSQPIIFRGRRAILVMAHDITAILYAEDALRESREQLQSLLDSSAEGIVGANLGGICTFCNAAGVSMLGYDSAGALVGKDVHAMIHSLSDGSECNSSECFLCKALRSGAQSHSSDDRFRRADGSPLLVEYWCHPVIRDEAVIGSVLTFFDTREKRKAEEALRRTEAQYTSIIEGAPYGIYRTDSDDRLLMANPALVTMLGYESEAELMRLNSGAAFYSHPQDSACQTGKYSNGCATTDVETTLTRKDGSLLMVRLRGRRRHSHQEEGYEVFVENITEKRHLERQLLQAQKMEAIGQLAGGVAHDFNNLLMMVNSFAELILSSSHEAAKVHHYATEIYEAGCKAAAVTRQLLAFSRSQVQDLKVLDLNTLVADWCRVLPRFLGEDIEMTFSSSKTPALVYADQAQIDQVIMNLVLNARDAMPKGGRVTMATESVRLDQAYFSARDVQINEGNYVMLSVSDTGCGMDATTKARVFEPFFTTKERNKGTGLGLATVYGIVKQSGGLVWVYSELNQGTVFKVYLPEARGTVRVVNQLPGAEDELTGSETILVVEDEPGIRDVICGYLRARNYKVLQAPNPVEALRILQQDDVQVDLVLTDMIMPGGSGPELAEAMHQMGRHLPVIFMSGYADRSVSGGSLASERVYLQKPFSLAKLARAVRTTLARMPELNG